MVTKITSVWLTPNPLYQHDLRLTNAVMFDEPSKKGENLCVHQMPKKTYLLSKPILPV